MTFGIVLLGLCLPLLSQTEPLSTPKTIDYPGIIETFEKLIQIDNDKNQKKMNFLMQKGQVFSEFSSLKNLNLDPDFLNSIVLHSDPGYLRMAATNKCRFYEAILTDLLKNADGKIKNIVINYINKGVRQSALVNKKDFLTKIIFQECSETQENIAAFQIKTINETLKDLDFSIPKGIDECKKTHSGWINNSKTPFICQIHEYLKDANLGDDTQNDLIQRKAVAKILEKKISNQQRDYISTLCTNLESEEFFCEEMTNVSYWDRILGENKNNIYSEDICQKVINSPNLSDDQRRACTIRLKKEPDLCLYPGGANTGLRPQPDCEQLSTALNLSSLKNTYKDCPGNSDQMIITNMGRIFAHFASKGSSIPETPCTAPSAFLFYKFNENFDNEETWKTEACYSDKISGKEICYKTFFGDNGESISYTSVVSNILKRTRGMDPNVSCEMVSNESYNPLLLRFKSGCFIIFESANCHISKCKHKIILNDRLIDFIRIKEDSNIAYFPLNLEEERFSQSYILTKGLKKHGRKMNDLTSIKKFFKRSSDGIIHGVGCAEDILPTFFKSYSLNQCTAIPFIIDGIIKNKGEDKVVFVTRTAADSVLAPRLISWSSIYSAVKSYQRKHPLKLWAMYGLD